MNHFTKNRIRKSRGFILLLVFGLVVCCSVGWSQAPPSPVDETETRGQQMLSAAIAALGGGKYLSVQDFTVTGRFYQIFHGVTSGAAVFVQYVKYPDKERQEIGKKKESIIINSGDQGWDIDYRAVRALTGEQVENYRRMQKYSLDRILRFDLKAKKYRVYFDGTEFIQGIKYDVVTLEDANRERMSLLLNASSHLPEALRYRLVDPKSKGVDRMENWYGNYQSVQGIMTPFHRERIRNGERISETFINEIKDNPGLSDALFIAR